MAAPKRIASCRHLRAFMGLRASGQTLAHKLNWLGSAGRQVHRGILTAAINLDVEFDSVAFIKTRKPGPLHRAYMDERIWLPIVARNETEALHRIEELDGSNCLLASKLTLRGFPLLHRDDIPDDLQVASRNFSAAINQREFQLLSLGKPFKAGALNRADVDKDIVPAFFALNEPEPLVLVEELYGTAALTDDLRRHSPALPAAPAEATAATAAFEAVLSLRTRAATFEPVVAAEPFLLTAVERIELFLAEPIPLVASPTATTSIETHLPKRTFASPHKRSSDHVDEARRTPGQAAAYAGRPAPAPAVIHDWPCDGDHNRATACEE